MIVFRGCQKCHGDVYAEANLDGADLVCLQCGFRRSIAGRPQYAVSVSSNRGELFGAVSRALTSPR